ncbi:unnamed protein product [Diabrotica balteata]|uniref:Cytochrome P450 n=1 Tax=Diabrotica balteata TaxID=107213 RepID=A0A9N9X7C3_DIABA|nr:unnamed protein product [Diabrotica balteata]
MILMLMLVAAGLTAALCFLVRKRWHYWKDLNVDQADITFILKNMYILFFKITSIVEMSVISYNMFPKSRYVGTYRFLKPMMLIKDPELIKDITIKHFDHFMDHTNHKSKNSDPLLWTKNLVALRGLQWRNMRSTLSPSFTSSKMKIMFTSISECAQNFSSYLQKKNQEIVQLELKETFKRCTNDVIATTLFGIKVDSFEDPDNEFYSMGRKMTNFSGALKTLKFLIGAHVPRPGELVKLPFFDKDLRNFFTNIIDKTVRMREVKGIVRPDMIHLLMEARKDVSINEERNTEGLSVVKKAENITGKSVLKDITNLDITAQALIFYLAGFETMASSMCFVGYELAANPDYQKRLRGEIMEHLNQCKGELTYESLLKMKYMDMFVSESLRKWPVAITNERQCTKDYIIKPERPEEASVTIKKGMTILMPVYPIHRDSKYYPDPDKFYPERFSDENKSKINPYTYLPFGLGPRNCIASRFVLLEIKVLFFHLLKDFEIVPVAKSQVPLVIPKGSFNLTSEGGFWFGLKRL